MGGTDRVAPEERQRLIERALNMYAAGGDVRTISRSLRVAPSFVRDAVADSTVPLHPNPGGFDWSCGWGGRPS